MPETLSPELLRQMHAYWRAANYLSVGQIYLKANPLLESPLAFEHVKPRLLGHWGTTPGLNLLYVHLNRLIVENDLNMIYVIGPGHGGPGIVANTYLEGSYTERYPAIEQSRSGIERLFRQFSWPNGIPSHVSPETPCRLRGWSQGFPATCRRKPLAPSTKAANWVTRWRMRTAPHSTIRTCSWPAWSATAKRRPARWPRAGIRTSS